MIGARHLTVVTRRECELCSELLALLQPLLEGGLIVIDERDVDADAELFARYCFRVPVVLEDGRELLWGRIEADEVMAALGGTAVAPSDS